VKYVYLLRKHPRMPYGGWGNSGHLEAFTVEGVFSGRAYPEAIASEKNKKSMYLWTVSKKEVKDVL
jgi:hypothetical protein